MSYKIVIAIDFGTSRSGYAYAFSDDGEIFYRDLWPGQRVPYTKTLTHLLYSPDLTVDSWGYEAPSKYNSLRRSGEALRHFYFQKFKMKLRDGENRGGNDGPYIIKNGRSFLVLDVIAAYIEVLKDLALQEIQQSVVGVLRSEEIRWCLTVPAIWNESQKALMRRAAVKAGLIKPEEISAERLLLALEPEAAALYCQQFEKLSLPTGTCFMVVDCGGGTVDITTYEVIDGRYLREVIPGTGGELGAMFVDLAFERYLVDKLSSAAVEKWDEQEPIEYLNFRLEDWERAKCEFDPHSGVDPVEIPLRPRLHRILEKQFPDVLDRLAVEQGDEDGYLYLSQNEMIELFREPLDGLVAKIQEQLRALGNRRCDYIYLVGGFSTSAVLRQRVQESFGRYAKIVMPPNPGAAIVGGAVHFGLNPTVIRARRARLTYGLSCSRPFEEGVDPKSKRFWSTDWNGWRCNDRFSVFVNVGDVIEVDEPISRIFHPAERISHTATFDILATRSKRVRYSDEPGVTKLGEITVRTPETDAGINRQIQCEMFFGKTEIRIQIKDVSSGESFTTSCRLSFTFSPELLGTV